MSLGDAVVTLKLSEVNKLQSDLGDANLRIAEMAKEVEEARLGDHAGVTRQYQKAFSDAMQVVRFAVGNLEPLTVRGWPYKNLFAIVEHLRALPGLDFDYEETSGDLKLFAEECKRWEIARDEGREQEMFQTENAARAPVTPT